MAEERFVAFIIPIIWTWDLHDYLYLFKENSTTAVRCKTVETIKKDTGFQWSYYSGPRYTEYTDLDYKVVTEPHRNAILFLPITENAGNLQYTVYFYDSLSPRRYEAYELLSRKTGELNLFAYTFQHLSSIFINGAVFCYTHIVSRTTMV